ncbi:hypothetical protein DH2020_027509 [Rehmannia glutinosa]|uniref:Alcohol dehydrogenase-like C-terminal domain-containing protein n=1 Tax=Rehmannia glutinosa TaxID=99300 RepID=A0ABR0VXT7_REHGL
MTASAEEQRFLLDYPTSIVGKFRFLSTAFCGWRGDLLKPHGKLVVFGLPKKPLDLPIFSLTMGRKMMGGSMIGGLKEMQEMIDFAAKHNILPGVEIISMDYVNTAMERLARGDVKFRFVIDVGKTFKEE